MTDREVASLRHQLTWVQRALRGALDMPDAGTVELVRAARRLRADRAHAERRLREIQVELDSATNRGDTAPTGDNMNAPNTGPVPMPTTIEDAQERIKELEAQLVGLGDQMQRTAKKLKQFEDGSRQSTMGPGKTSPQLCVKCKSDLAA